MAALNRNWSGPEEKSVAPSQTLARANEKTSGPEAAGMAAVYSVPLGGAIFALEVCVEVGSARTRRDDDCDPSRNHRHP